MAKITTVDTGYKSFTENVADALVGKEGYAVEMVDPIKQTVQLYNAGIPIGVMFERLEGSQAINVRMFGKSGTVRAVAGGAIAAPAYVKLANTGKVVAANSGDRSIGIALTSSAADGDFIEVLDQTTTMP